MKKYEEAKAPDYAEKNLFSLLAVEDPPSEEEEKEE